MNTSWIIGHYQLRSMRQSLLILGIIMVGVVALSVPISLLVEGPIVFMSLEISSAISVLVAGLTAFTPCFGFALQNAVSRRNIYLGTLLAGLGVAAAFGLMEFVIFLLSMGAEALAANLSWVSMLELMYAARYTGSVLLHFEFFVFNTMLNLMLFMAGYFIAAAYYRMGKLMKTIVSVGVPVLMVVLVPAIDILTGHKLFSKLAELLARALGLPTANPWCAMGTFLLFAASLALLTWPLIRRAVVKE